MIYFILQFDMPPQRSKAKVTGSKQQQSRPLASSGRQRRGRQARQKIPRLQSPATESVSQVSNIIPESLVNDVVERVVERLSTKLPVVNQCASGGESSSSVESAAALVDSSISAMQAILARENSPASIPESLFTSPSLPIDARVSDKVKAKIWNNEFVDFGLL